MCMKPMIIVVRPGNTEDFHTLAMMLSNASKLGQVVDAYCYLLCFKPVT